MIFLWTLSASAIAQDHGYIVQVSLPITGEGDLKIQQALREIAKEVGATDKHPPVVLEFLPAKDGESSQFERCLALARFLASGEVSSLHTVAYLDGEVNGHAVLAVLACKGAVVTPAATLGPATMPGEAVDETTLQGYREIAAKRRTAAPEVAISMVDPAKHLLRAELLDGAVFVEQSELAALQADKTVTSVETITRPGSAARLDADQLRRFYIATYQVQNRSDLPSVLKVRHLEERRVAHGGNRKGLRLRFIGALTPGDVKSQTRTVQDVLLGDEVDGIVIEIDSPGGAPSSAARLANQLAEIDPAKVQTIAFISGEARGDAWLIASACDEIVAARGAILGGPGAAAMSEREANALVAVAQRIAALKQRDWSLTAGLLDPTIEVSLYRHEVTNAERNWTDAEFSAREDREQWQMVRPLDLREGMVSDQALQLGQIHHLSDSIVETLKSHQFPVDELKEHSTPWIVTQVERMAASPWLARLLLTIGFFALLAEFSAPGLGAPGFTAAVCFLLFFWIQFLNGTAGYLELTLFLGGLASLALELFVIPGFGVFGFGGAAMMLISLGLACQTFVIPGNSYQWTQLSSSLFTMIAGIAGGIAGAVVMRLYLPRTPYLKNLMLETPSESPQSQSSTLAYLHGKRGTTITRLRPSGKAKFGDHVVDVLTDGEMVDEGSEVVVREVRGSHVVVRALDHV